MSFNNSAEISEAVYLAVMMIALGIAAMAALISILFAVFSIVCAASDYLSDTTRSIQLPGQLLGRKPQPLNGNFPTA